MKLLIITDTIGENCTKGSEIFCSELTHRLRSGNNVTVVATSASGSEVEEADGIIRIGTHLLGDPDALRGCLLKRVSVRDYDLIYNLGGMIFGNTVASAFLASNGPLPLVNHFQAMLGSYAGAEGYGDETIDLNREGQKEIAEQGLLNIFLSQSEYRDALLAGFDVSRCVVSVIPAGVQCGELRSVVAGDWQPPARPNGGKRPTVYLAAGRFDDYIKGADLIYRAFTYLHQRHSDVFLLVISNSRRFASLLRELPEDTHEIIGWLPRKEFLATLALADVVVLPSRYESFGLIAVEAMMLEKPVIANNVGGLQEIVHHGKTGILNDLREGSYGLYRALKIFADNTRLRAEMGKAGRRHAEREFDLDRVAGLVQKSFDAALMRHRSLATSFPF